MFKRILVNIPLALLCLMMLGGGIADILRPDNVVEIMTRLGYPPYFSVMLGIAKVLGVIALLAPVGPTLRTFAYAGFTFNTIAAIVSHLAAGDPLPQSIPAAAGLLLALSSFAIWRARSAHPYAAIRLT